MNRVTIDDLLAHVDCGKRKAFRLVRERKLPGLIDGRTWICSPGEFEHWKLTGEVIQNRPASTEPHSKKCQPVGLHAIKGKAA